MGLRKNKVLRFGPGVTDNHFERRQRKRVPLPTLEVLDRAGFGGASPSCQMQLFISGFFQEPH